MPFSLRLVGGAEFEVRIRTPGGGWLADAGLMLEGGREAIVVRSIANGRRKR